MGEGGSLSLSQDGDSYYGAPGGGAGRHNNTHSSRFRDVEGLVGAELIIPNIVVSCSKEAILNIKSNDS